MTTPERILSFQQQRLQTFSSLLVENSLSSPRWTAETQQQFQQCWTGSEFVWDICFKVPALALTLLDRGLLHRSYTSTEMHDTLDVLLEGCDSEELLMSRLRRFREQQQFRIIFRDLNRLASMTETTTDVSAMADACIQRACDWLYDDCCQQLGTPYGTESDAAPSPQKLIVLGMGKLGANELNLSSDVDLIFCYPSKGETRGAPRSLSSQEFFVRLGQRLIKVLDSNTAEGFVFRVDMRLRPYGQSGALALSSTAMEQYYQDQGRDWERYAMIKARYITGDDESAQQLMDMLRPFVFRRYIDYGAILALRDMKRMISREVARRNLHDNIKLGHGGIREIEFIVQSFQLIHGGKDWCLQQRSLLATIDQLEYANYLPSVVCNELREANTFLRNVEHALQAFADKQTQTLPNNPDELLRLAWVMGFESQDAFIAQLNLHRGQIEEHFSAIVSEAVPEKKGSECSGTDWQAFWSGRMEPDEEIPYLENLGFSQPTEVHKKLVILRDGKILKTVRRQSADRINQFMPRLLDVVLSLDDPDQVLFRQIPIVEAVLRRTAYLVLLMENPGALDHLVSLCASSPWIAEQIARFPALLDEFLNLGSLYTPPDKTELEDELRQQLTHIPEDDLENQMEALRYFRMAHMLRVTAAQVTGKMPLMKESDYLTWTAETILSTALDIIRNQLISRHGVPGLDEGNKAPGFLIIGYGKLGGIELGPSSDLDLVFIHNGDPSKMTDGERSIDNAMFFTRLGQRLVHMLSTNTASGQLYEVDTRLRPSGHSGLLVSSLAAFEKYQTNDAWTWEHQALVRARCIAGDSHLAQAFEAVRVKVLTRKREREALCKSIREMRQKMVANFGTKATKGGTLAAGWNEGREFHIKHDRGGIVDIEFIVQYAVLVWSHDYPILARWTDNIRILKELERVGLLSTDDVQSLSQAYQAYRKTVHRRALQNQSSLIKGDQMHSHRQAVIRIWNELLDDEVTAHPALSP